jgi:hypothetical protein
MPLTPAHAGGAEMSKDIVAVQVRKQGFKCDNPVSAERDESASKPDATTWILTCVRATYKVLLVPKMAARVKQLATDSNASEP